MATKEKRARRSGGPYLSAAFFCEKIIEDRDSALSLIRLVDKTTLILDPSNPPDFPSERKPLPVVMSGLISFKTGDSPGDHTIRLDMESPSGKKTEKVFEQKLTFGNEAFSGVNIKLNSTIMVKKGGVFRMHVYLDDKLITQIPFEISVQRSERPLMETLAAAK